MIDKDSQESVDETMKYFRAVLGVYKQAVDYVVDQGISGNAREQCVALLAAAANERATSMALLCEHQRACDAMCIARSTLETLINACFIHLSGLEVAERAIAHARQKGYRDLDRLSAIGDSRIEIRWAGDPNQLATPDMIEAIKKFSRKNGTECTQWIHQSIEERLRFICQVGGVSAMTPFHLAFVSIYRHASEYLHGTVFGAAHAVGAAEPNARAEAGSLDERHRMTIVTILMLIGLCLDSTVSLLVDVNQQARIGESLAIARSLLRDHAAFKPTFPD